MALLQAHPHAAQSQVEHALGGAPDSRISSSDIVNAALAYLTGLHEWTWRKTLTTLSLTADENYIDLPADFETLIGLLPAPHAAAPTLKLALDRGRGPATGRRRRRRARSTWRCMAAGPQAAATDVPTRRLLLGITPDADEADCLVLLYRKMLPTLANDTDVPAVPYGLFELLRVPLPRVRGLHRRTAGRARLGDVQPADRPSDRGRLSGSRPESRPPAQNQLHDSEERGIPPQRRDKDGLRPMIRITQNHAPGGAHSAAAYLSNNKLKAAIVAGLLALLILLAMTLGGCGPQAVAGAAQALSDSRRQRRCAPGGGRETAYRSLAQDRRRRARAGGRRKTNVTAARSDVQSATQSATTLSSQLATVQKQYEAIYGSRWSRLGRLLWRCSMYLAIAASLAFVAFVLANMASGGWAGVLAGVGHLGFGMVTFIPVAAKGVATALKDLWRQLRGNPATA